MATCDKCGRNSSLLIPEYQFVRLENSIYCPNCVNVYAQEKIKAIKATSTNSIDGYFVKSYIDIESVEIVVGTGVFSEFNSEFADFFGTRSTGFELKLQKAKKLALDKLKYLAFQKGGNAVIGIDIDYTEFSANRIGVILNGTIVEILPIPAGAFRNNSNDISLDNYDDLPEL